MSIELQRLSENKQLMDVSIIIVNYNTKYVTKSCIDSIFSQTKGLVFEVILVDNASCDGSKELFEYDSRIRYIYNSENIGFGVANNLGYEYSRGKYIFLLNSDTILLNNAIYEMFLYMESANNSIGCVGCVLSDINGREMHSYGTFPSIKTYVYRILAYYHIRLKGYSDIPRKGDIYPLLVDYVTGADLFVRKEIIDKYGLFDPDFFMYYEETDLQFRFRSNGYISQIITTPRIMHLQGASQHYKRLPLQMTYIELESRLRYARKNLDGIQSFIVSILHLIMIPKILVFNAKWCDKIKIIKLIISYL